MADTDFRTEKDNSSFSGKLRDAPSSKGAYGKKMSERQSSQMAAAKKLKDSRSGAEKYRRFSNEKEGSSNSFKHLISNEIHYRVNQDSDDNAGKDALNFGTEVAERIEEEGSNAYSRYHQKRAIKNEYASARSGKASASSAYGNASKTAQSPAQRSAQKAAQKAKQGVEKVKDYVSGHGGFLLIGGSLLLLIFVMTGMMESCFLLFQGSTGMVADTSYTAERADILGVEEDYQRLEEEIQSRIDNIRTEYTGFDEYVIVQDEIGHDPYELASLLTVRFDSYSRSIVQVALREILNYQYELLTETETETRYRTETRTGTRTKTRTEIDFETGEEVEVEYEEPYEFEEEVPYEYRTLHVRLVNKGIANEDLLSGLTEDLLTRYRLLMETRGNMPDLFSEEP